MQARQLLSLNPAVRQFGQPWSLPEGTITWQPTFTFIPQISGPYDVTLIVDTPAGQATASESISVNNIAPRVTSFSITTGQEEGDTFGIAGTFADGTGDWHEGEANWGDSQAWLPLQIDDEEQTFWGSHLYVQNGSYSGVVSVRDNWSATSWPFGVSVSQADPVIDQISGSVGADETESLSIQTQLHDAGIWDSHNIVIAWGDGETSTFSANLRGQNTAGLGGSHTYTDSGSYTVTITAIDTQDSSSSDSISFGVVINNVAPTANISADATISMGGYYTLQLDAWDVSPADRAALHYSFAHDPEYLAEDYAGASANCFSLMGFDSPGTHTVWARVLDKDGGCNDYPAQVTVLPAGIVASAGAQCTLVGVGCAHPTLTVSSGSLTFTTDGGMALPGLDLVVAAGATARFKSVQHLHSLTIEAGDPGGVVYATSRPNSPIVVKSLEIGTGGKLDLRNGSLILDYDPAPGGGAPGETEVDVQAMLDSFPDLLDGEVSSEQRQAVSDDIAGAAAADPVMMAMQSGPPGALGTIRSYILGDGITSSWVQQFSGRTLAVDQTSQSWPWDGLWCGQPVDDSAVLVRYGGTADVNFDGTVGFDELLALAQHYGVTQGMTWHTGDFTGDGAVNFDDLLVLAQHYHQTSGLVPTVSITQLPTSPPVRGDMISLGHTTVASPGAEGEVSYNWTGTRGTTPFTGTGTLSFVANQNAPYVINLSVSDGDGVLCTASASFGVGVPDAPVVSGSIPQDNVVVLNWQQRSNVTQYTVESSITGADDDWAPLGTTSATSFSYFVQRRYFYRVRAENTYGPSAWSNVLCPTFKPEDNVVEVSATAQSSPTPAITLHWTPKSGDTPFLIYRKSKDATSWGTRFASGYGNAYTDTNVTVGCAFEYEVAVGTATGSVYSGIEAPLVEHRGTVLLIMTELAAGANDTALAQKVERLKLDLIGDGWTVVTPEDPSEVTASVASVKQFILDSYTSDVKSVFLLGNVPIPLTPYISPDGHDDLRRFPADCYYGDLDESLWDIGTDGIFTNTSIPSDGDSEPIELAVGRVDLSNMWLEFRESVSESEEHTETRLLKQYLDKDHNFRTHVTTVQNRGFIEDAWGNAEINASGAWRDLSAFFGSGNIDVPAPRPSPVDPETSLWFPTVEDTSYLWGYAGGGGWWPQKANCIVETDDFAAMQSKVIFASFFGSFLGQWDQHDSLLQAPLANSGYGLTNVWTRSPMAFYEMGVGQTIGESVRRYQCGLFSGSDLLVASLLGDPTLRMHVVAPVGSARKSTSQDGVSLTWTGSADASLGNGVFLGYNVYRAESAEGPFTKINTSYVTGTSFFDSEGAGSNVYMIKAIKVEGTGINADEVSGSGTYINSSRGVIAVEEQ